MRNFLKFVPIFLAAFFIVQAARAETPPINVVVDGVPVEFRDQDPLIVGGRTLVPLRDVLEMLGATVNWDEETRTVIVDSGREPNFHEPHVPAAAPKSASEFELLVFELTNAARESYGLPAFVWHDGLANAARLHSTDLAENKDIISHTGSDGSSVGDRLTRADIYYRGFAENIAGGFSDAQAVVDGWMGSEGHRENILNEHLTHLGVGFDVIHGSTFRYYITQKFAVFWYS